MRVGAETAISTPFEPRAVFKQITGSVLRQLYAALINCPEGPGKSALMDMLDPLGEQTQQTEQLPTAYALYQNYPNPFNPSTTIRFAQPREGRVTLTVYNIMGQKTAVLYDGYLNKGYHEVVWDGTDFSGKPVASGIYFYRLESDAVNITKRMMLLK
jgi:hypothetical protein